MSALLRAMAVALLLAVLPPGAIGHCGAPGGQAEACCPGDSSAPAAEGDSARGQEGEDPCPCPSCQADAFVGGAPLSFGCLRLSGSLSADGVRVPLTLFPPAIFRPPLA